MLKYSLTLWVRSRVAGRTPNGTCGGSKGNSSSSSSSSSSSCSSSSVAVAVAVVVAIIVVVVVVVADRAVKEASSLWAGPCRRKACLPKCVVFVLAEEGHVTQTLVAGHGVLLFIYIYIYVYIYIYIIPTLDEYTPHINKVPARPKINKFKKKVPGTINKCKHKKKQKKTIGVILE